MRYFLLSFVLVVSGLLLNSSVLFADKVCVKKKLKVKANGRVPHRNAVKVESGDCPRKFVELLDTDTFTGPQGPAGEDASSLLYGNGTAGDLVVDAFASIESANLNFENITIEAGQTLQLRSGTIIRCTGTFVNNGTIQVATYAQGGSLWGPDGQVQRIATPGRLVGSSATVGRCDAAGTSRSGGVATPGIAAAGLRQFTRLGPIGGGGGHGRASGGEGGGTVTILCNGAISISGTITANGGGGGSGSGGGGGGIVLLASATSISNTGTIEAKGGDGGASDLFSGAGGGGGGGLVHFISPTISAGTVDVSGGVAGDNSVDATADPACGGGSGGSGAGISGSGGNVSFADNSEAAVSGLAGSSIETTEDPVEVFGAY